MSTKTFIISFLAGIILFVGLTADEWIVRREYYKEPAAGYDIIYLDGHKEHHNYIDWWTGEEITE